MVSIEILLSDKDFDRLAYLKDSEGKQDKSYNDFAEELLTRYLHKLCPKAPEKDDNDNWQV